MKQRVITGVVGLLIFFVALASFGTFIFNIVISIVSAIIVHELLSAYRYTDNRLITWVCCIFAGLFPVVYYTGYTNCIYMAVVFAGILVAISLRYHEKIKLEQIGMAFFIALAYPFSMTSILIIREQFGLVYGIFITLMIFTCAWGSDTGAYFIGRFFGKRKLAPKLSPNKTVEGVFGGIFSCMAFVAIITTSYFYIVTSIGEIFNFNLVFLAIMTILGSLVGVSGDLFASMIKRQCGIKDFGTIFPGHGGVVDRFDSVLMIAPFILVAVQFIR